MSKRLLELFNVALTTLREDDRMPEVDFDAPAAAAPMDDQMDIPPLDDGAGFDSFDEPAADQQEDLPSITLSDTEKAVLSLIIQNEQTKGSARDKIDFNPNARWAIKRLIKLGVVETTTAGLYAVSELGKKLMASANLTSPDDPTSLSNQGQTALQQYFH